MTASKYVDLRERFITDDAARRIYVALQREGYNIPFDVCDRVTHKAIKEAVQEYVERAGPVPEESA